MSLGCRLFGWGTLQYCAPTLLSPKHVLSNLAHQSQAMQLQLVMQHIEGACIDPLKICRSEDDLSRSAGFDALKDQYHGQHSKQPVVWLQNSSVFMQKDTELCHTLYYLAAYADDGSLLQGSTDHYLVLSYSRATAKKTVDEVVSAFAYMSPRFEVKAVYTTVQPLSVPSASSGNTAPALLPCSLDSSLPYMLVVFRNQPHDSVAQKMQTGAMSAETAIGVKLAASKVSKPASVAISSTGKRPGDAKSEVPPAKKHAGAAGSPGRADEAVHRDRGAAHPDTTQVLFTSIMHASSVCFLVACYMLHFTTVMQLRCCCKCILEQHSCNDACLLLSAWHSFAVMHHACATWPHA